MNSESGIVPGKSTLPDYSLVIILSICPSWQEMRLSMESRKYDSKYFFFFKLYMPCVEDNTENNVIDLIERAACTFHELYFPIMLHLSSY